MVSLKINKAPIAGAIAVPRELKACDKFNLLEALSSVPKTATYGFAATCNNVIPPARIKYATIKIPKTLNEAAG